MPLKLDNQSANADFVQWTTQDGKLTQEIRSKSTKTWVDSRNGEPVNNFRWKIRRGFNATGPYTCTFQRWNPVSIRASGKITEASGSTLDRDFAGSPPGIWPTLQDPTLLPLSDLDRSARQQFIAKYRSKRTQFQAGVFLGELAETVRMIRNPAQSLRRGIDDYYKSVKKRLRRSKNRRRTVRDTWLEYAFGWSPLVNDVENACRLATAHPYAALEKISAFSSGQTTKLRQNDEFSYGHLRALWVQERVGEATVKYKGAVGARNSPPGFPEQLGLSWSNVLPTIWELIPYSFLVDYFTNVGNVIEGISTGTISLSWGCKVTVQKSFAEIVNVQLDEEYLQGFKPSGGSATGFAAGGGEAGSRTVITRNSISSLSFGIGDFGFKLPGSGLKWLNIAALAKLRR